MTVDSGTKLGRYEVRSPIGAGGMGEVYLAVHPRQWVDVFKFCLHQKPRASPRIPRTAVGGCLQVLPTSKGPSLSQNPTHGSGWMSSSSAYIKGPEPLPESHPRQWVDVFKFCLHQKPRASPRIPPTAVGGCLQVLPTSKAPSLSRNPTHGSGWMSSSPPYIKRPEPLPESHPRQWVDSSSSAYIKRPEPLPESHPRQWVDVFKFRLRSQGISMSKRSDLNYPPTAVGGILEATRPVYVGWT
jgi:hypothetical protein